MKLFDIQVGDYVESLSGGDGVLDLIDERYIGSIQDVWFDWDVIETKGRDQVVKVGVHHNETDETIGFIIFTVRPVRPGSAWEVIEINEERIF
jgi:hypothetical protein